MGVFLPGQRDELAAGGGKNARQSGHWHDYEAMPSDDDQHGRKILAEVVRVSHLHLISLCCLLPSSFQLT